MITKDSEIVVPSISNSYSDKKSLSLHYFFPMFVCVVGLVVLFGSGHVAEGGSVSYALDHVNGFHSYGGEDSVGGFDNPSNETDNGNGHSAPLACAVNKQKSNRACVNAGSSFNKWLRFGVFSVYEKSSPNNGGTVLMTVRDGAGQNYGWSSFWKAPSLSGSGSDLEKPFQYGYTKSNNGESAKSNGIKGSGLFNGGPNGEAWNISNADVYDTPGAKKNLKNLYDDASYSNLGKSTIYVTKNSTVRLEWSCQPYQIQYFEGKCAYGGDCTVAKMLRLFDGAQLANLPSGNGNKSRSGVVDVTVKADANYSMRCESSGYSGGSFNFGSVGSWSLNKQDSQFMKIAIKVVEKPTGWIRHNEVGESAGTTNGDFDVRIDDTSGKATFRLQAHAAADSGDSMKNTSIFYDNSNYTTSGDVNDSFRTFNIDTPGTHTFYAEAKTDAYSDWTRMSGANLTVTVLCPVGQIENGAGACVDEEVNIVVFNGTLKEGEADGRFKVTRLGSGTLDVNFSIGDENGRAIRAPCDELLEQDYHLEEGSTGTSIACGTEDTILRFTGDTTIMTVWVRVHDDSLFEPGPEETVSMNIEPGDGYEVGSENTATVSIEDNEAEPMVNMEINTGSGYTQVTKVEIVPNTVIFLKATLTGSANTCSYGANHVGSGGSAYGAYGDGLDSLLLNGVDIDENIDEPGPGSKNATEFTAQCVLAGANGVNYPASDSIRVTTRGDVVLEATDYTVRPGQKTTLLWDVNAHDISTCSLIGPGINLDGAAGELVITDEAYGGSEEVTIYQRSEYTLDCTDTNDGSDKATIEIVPQIFES